MRRRWAVSALLVLVGLGLIGCSSDEDDGLASSNSTGPTIPAGRCNPKTDPAEPAAPAESFYEAWRVGDEAYAEKLGTPAAVDALFELQPNGTEWEFQGCTAGEEPDAGDCAFTYEGGSTHFTIAHSADEGWSITEVFQVAD